MKELLHNMSAPPRSTVTFEQEQLKKYILFSPINLTKLLSKKTNTIIELEKMVQDYYIKHKDALNKTKKPTGYMIGSKIEINRKNINLKMINEAIKQYDYIECNDINLLIIIFSQTVGDLYIPNRQLSFESSKFDNILLFPEDEVNS